MPKQMFNNISKEKQEMFLDVAIEEFTSKSFEHVSVNSIVKKAGISRGSFYNYFEDLDELFNYIFNQIKEERFIYAKGIIKESKKDFFVFIRKLFEYDYESYKSKDRYSLFRNYIHYIQLSKKGSIKDSIILPIGKEFGKNESDFSKIFDYRKYAINFSEFLDLMEMTMIIAVNTFIKSENENLKKEEVLILFNKRIDIIEIGSRKREK